MGSPFKSCNFGLLQLCAILRQLLKTATMTFSCGDYFSERTSLLGGIQLNAVATGRWLVWKDFNLPLISKTELRPCRKTSAEASLYGYTFHNVFEVSIVNFPFPFHCMYVEGHEGVWVWEIGPQNYFWIVNFHSISKPHVAFSLSCMQRKGGHTVDPKVNYRVVWTWDIQIGPFGVHEAHLPQGNFYFFKSQMRHFPFPACR